MKIINSIIFILLFNNSFSQISDAKSETKRCIENICFEIRPSLTYSHLEQSNYDGEFIRVYNLFYKSKSIDLDSLLNKGYEKLPLKKLKLTQPGVQKYLSNKDVGYYYFTGVKEDPSKLIILNLSNSTLMIIMSGDLHGVLKEE